MPLNRRRLLTVIAVLAATAVPTGVPAATARNPAAPFTPQARKKAFQLAAADTLIRQLLGNGRTTVVRSVPWTTAATDRFIGAVVTLDLGGPRSVDTIWPSWACAPDGQAQGILVHIVATNVVRPLIGVDLRNNRIRWVDPGPEAIVTLRERQGKTTTPFPPMACDEDSEQLE